MNIYKLAILFLLVFQASPAFADVVWPAMFLEMKMLIWWVIAFGLIIEYVFLRIFFKMRILEGIKICIVMNFISTLLGIILIPLSGIAWEIVPGMIIYPIFNMGTFNPLTWSATFILAVLVNLKVESWTIIKIFKRKMQKREYFFLALANAFSVGIAYYCLFIDNHF
ncbi:MAG: hypothetical protein H6755_05975 [Candidatus Omnitrophica bacterium]|nr:hypothetical protein [Candidatus Omnitrophota bacterium]